MKVREVQGLPADQFASTEAPWLAVQPQGQAEQPRVVLLSVSYALKAEDVQTMGGLPASAFVLATAAGNAESCATGAAAAAGTNFSS